MVKRVTKKIRIKNIILTAVSIILVVAIVVLGLLWNRHLNKNNLIGKFETPQRQEVYLLGTFHDNHFNKWLNYSMEDVLSVVKNTQPDVVFIEAREESFKNYGVVDGPVDMSVIYSYCIDNNIPVEMVDWWVVDNNFKENTTNDKRDDMIFSNINSKLKQMNSDIKVLAVCGAGHFYEQSERFLNNGFVKQKIDNKAACFVSKDKKFEYPSSLEDVWEKRAYFYAYIFPELIEQDKNLDDNIKSRFTKENHDAYYDQKLKYNELFANDELYK